MSESWSRCPWFKSHYTHRVLERVFLGKTFYSSSQVLSPWYAYDNSKTSFNQSTRRNSMIICIVTPLSMLCAIDGSSRSINRAARSMDPSLAQTSIDRPNIDRSRCAIDRWSCTIDHSRPSMDACTVRHVDDWPEAEWLRFWCLGLCNVSIYIVGLHSIGLVFSWAGSVNGSVSYSVIRPSSNLWPAGVALWWACRTHDLVVVSSIYSDGVGRDCKYQNGLTGRWCWAALEKWAGKSVWSFRDVKRSG